MLLTCSCVSENYPYLPLINDTKAMPRNAMDGCPSTDQRVALACANMDVEIQYVQVPTDVRVSSVLPSLPAMTRRQTSPYRHVPCEHEADISHEFR
jgi:hypothetical protein